MVVFHRKKHQRGQSYSWYIVHVIIQLDSWIYGGEIVVDFRSRIGLLCLIVSHLIDRTILALACSHKTYKHCSPIGLECITVSRKTSLPHTPEKSIFLISKTISNILEGFCIVNTEKFYIAFALVVILRHVWPLWGFCSIVMSIFKMIIFFGK